MESPALARGLDLWRLIERQGPLSLGDLAEHTRLPKSSLLRLLETLANYGLIMRAPATKLYGVAARLVLLDVPQDFDTALQSALDQLSAATHATAEWYVPNAQGMLLVRRAEPADCEVGVRAKIGFVRSLAGEMEAVCALGNAWFGKPAAGYKGCRAYLKDGVLKSLSSSAARTIVDNARRNGWAVDGAFNGNGVRRRACVVVRDGKALGVLSLAEVYRLSPRSAACDLLKNLLAYGEALCHDASFTYGSRR